MTIRDTQREIRKASKQQKNDRLEYARGVGATTAGVGLIAGGIPGEIGESDKWDPVHRKNPDGSKSRPKPKAVLQSLKGGILGYRVDAHQRELADLRRKAKASDANPTEKIHEFNRGVYDYGGHAPEKKIIPQLKRARTAANVVLVGGVGAAAGASYLKNQNNKKYIKKSLTPISKKKKRYQAQVAGGATLTGASLAGGKVLEHQGNKWAQTTADEFDKAKKIIPEMGGWENAPSKHNVRHVAPEFEDDAINGLGNLSEKHTTENLRQAGIHRGNAAKARYFANTYGNNAKWVRRIGVPIGVAGMALGSKKVQQKTDNARNKTADAIRPHGVTKGFTTPVGSKKVLRPLGRVKGWADEEVGFVKKPTIAVNTKGEAKVVAKPHGGEGSLGGSFDAAPSKGKYDAWSVKTSPKDKPATTVTKRIGPFGVAKMAWDEKTTPMYWKLKARADRGSTDEEKAAFKAKLDEHTKKHKVPGQDTPPEYTNPEYKPPRPPSGSGQTPGGGQAPPRGNYQPPSGGFNASDFEDFIRRNQPPGAKEYTYDGPRPSDEKTRNYANANREKTSAWERKEWGGKTRAERAADYAAKPSMANRWKMVPKTNKVAGGMYAAAGAATVAGAAYVHHNNPNRKTKVHKAQQQAQWKDYNNREKAGYTASTGAALGGGLGSLGAYERNQKHFADMKTSAYAADQHARLAATQTGDFTKATEYGDKALRSANKAKTYKKIFHGSNAVGLVGLGGMTLTALNAQNRKDAKKRKKP